MSHDQSIADSEQLRPSAGGDEFRQLFTAILDYAIIVLTPGGLIRSWNPGAHRLHGYDEHEIVGQYFEQKPEAEL